MKKKEYICHLIQKSEEEFQNNEVVDAEVENETLREKYALYDRDNMEAGIEDVEAGRTCTHNEVKGMLRK